MWNTQEGAEIMNRETMPSWASASGHYQAELSSDQLDAQGRLIDLVIDFAFETLGATHFDLRVTPSGRLQAERREPYTRTDIRS
jgi:hypothetical protein